MGQPGHGRLRVSLCPCAKGVPERLPREAFAEANIAKNDLIQKRCYFSDNTNCISLRSRSRCGLRVGG